METLGRGARNTSIEVAEFLDPMKVNAKNLKDDPQGTEDYVYHCFQQWDSTAKLILLPYNFGFHWNLMMIELERSRVTVLDSLRKPETDYKDCTDMLSR